MATTTTRTEPASPTLVDLRHPLPTRPIVGPRTTAQLTEARAALASAQARLPIPVINWQTLPNGRAGAYLRDDTLIVHTAHRAPHFLALVPCPHGARHQHRVTDGTSLATARNTTAACTTPHGPGPAVRSLADAFSHDNESTQPLNLDEQAKEHPQT